MSQPQPSEEWAAFRAEILSKTTRPARKPKAPKTITANDLTRQIVQFLKQQGAFATRLQSIGTYRADLQKFVPSQQRAGMPDVFAVFESRVVLIEIKTANDRLSDDQKQTIADLTKAGAWVFVAHDFDSFKEWFVRWFQTPPCP